MKQIPYAHAALKHLRTVDPVMAQIISAVGPLQMARRPHRFQSLVRAIIFQQLAGNAAQAIYNRFVGMFGTSRFPTPAMVLEASDSRLRTAGLSRQKIVYIKDLAAHAVAKSLNFTRFTRMEDEAIIAELMRVKGIGRWTAEMFLMFNLGRPDVLPIGDLGFRNGLMKAYKIAPTVKAAKLMALGEKWRPYRSVAVWYLWQSQRLTLPDGNQSRSGRSVRMRSKRSSR